MNLSIILHIVQKMMPQTRNKLPRKCNRVIYEFITKLDTALPGP